MAKSRDIYVISPNLLINTRSIYCAHISSLEASHILPLFSFNPFALHTNPPSHFSHCILIKHRCNSTYCSILTLSVATAMSKLFSGCFGKFIGSRQKSRPKKVTSKQRSIQRLSFSDVSNSGVFSPEDLSISLVGSNLYAFTIAELQTVTQGFSMSNFIGEGGFGPVYKGYVDEKVKPGLKAQPVAVKLLDLDGVQGHKEWLVSFLHFFSCC